MNKPLIALIIFMVVGAALFGVLVANALGTFVLR